MRVILLLSMLASLIACSSFIKNGAIVEAQNALKQSKFEEALENIDIAESFGELSEANTAKLHYLRGQSLEGLEQKDEAAHSYRYVVENHAQSAYSGPSQQRLDAIKKSAVD